MPLPVQSQEEQLSVSYVSAVAARAGYACQTVPQDYGVDLSIRRVQRRADGKYVDVGVALDCQLKATTNWQDTRGEIVYDMDVDAYNKLVFRRQNSSSPCVLVLFCLPKDQNAWLTVDATQLQLRHCCYWTCLDGGESANARSQRVAIAKGRLLTPDALRAIVRDALSGVLR